MKKNNAGTDLKRKTFRLYFFAKSLLNRLDLRMLKIKEFVFWRVRQKALRSSHLQTEADHCTGCYNRGLSPIKQPHSCPCCQECLCREVDTAHKADLMDTEHSVSDGITLSCSRLHHRKENLYLLMALPPSQNCALSMRRGAQRKLEKRKAEE